MHLVFVYLFVCISLTADEPQRARLPIPCIATLSSCLWPLRIFLPLSGFPLWFIFYRDASPTFLHLVNQWLNLRTHVLTLSATEARIKDLILSDQESNSQLRTSDLRGYHYSTRTTSPRLVADSKRRRYFQSKVNWSDTLCRRCGLKFQCKYASQLEHVIRTTCTCIKSLPPIDKPQVDRSLTNTTHNFVVGRGQFVYVSDLKADINICTFSLYCNVL